MDHTIYHANEYDFVQCACIYALHIEQNLDTFVDNTFHWNVSRANFKVTEFELCGT